MIVFSVVVGVGFGIGVLVSGVFYVFFLDVLGFVNVVVVLVIVSLEVVSWCVL